LRDASGQATRRARVVKSLFREHLEARVGELGGLYNAHLHLDRVGTLAARYWSGSDGLVDVASLSLATKHGMIPSLHDGPAYEPADLAARVNRYLDWMISVNTRCAETVVDVTVDRVGLSAIRTLHEIKQSRAGEIDLRLGAYSPLGFVDAEPERWELLESALEYADFIGSLPEVDDHRRNPGHIGFATHLERVLNLAASCGKEVHVHLDQLNHPRESGTETLLSILRELEWQTASPGHPTIWAIHVISPSTYEERRFESLVESLVEFGVGVICCPSAALGMRQLRRVPTPTYNSIARVLDFLAAGIPVRLGNDNMDDICSPSTGADLFEEVILLSAALRFYRVDVLARLAAGQPLSDTEREAVRQHLAADAQESEAILRELDRPAQKSV